MINSQQFVSHLGIEVFSSLVEYAALFFCHWCKYITIACQIPSGYRACPVPPHLTGWHNIDKCTTYAALNKTLLRHMVLYLRWYDKEYQGKNWSNNESD